MDNHRAAKDEFGFDVALGHNIARHFAAELNYSNLSAQIHRSASDKIGATTLDGLYKVLPGAIFDYVIIGAYELTLSPSRRKK